MCCISGAIQPRSHTRRIYVLFGVMEGFDEILVRLSLLRSVHFWNDHQPSVHDSCLDSAFATECLYVLKNVRKVVKAPYVLVVWTGGGQLR